MSGWLSDLGDRIRDALDGSERTQALTDIGNGEGYAGNMLGGKGAGAAKAGKFPSNPDDLLPNLPRDAKGRIYPNTNTRIRPEQHPIQPGENFSPRHHGPHYHVEVRINPNKSWNNKGNVIKIEPPTYVKGEGTGFLPGEPFPQ